MATIEDEDISDVILLKGDPDPAPVPAPKSEDEIDDEVFSHFEGQLGEEPTRPAPQPVALTEERVLQIMDTVQRVISNQNRIEIERYASYLQKQLNVEIGKRQKLKVAFNEHVVHYRLLFRVVLDKMGPKTKASKSWFPWWKPKKEAPKLVIPPKPVAKPAPRPQAQTQSVSSDGWEGKEFGD